jgi:small subunit ribosomal protein S17
MTDKVEDKTKSIKRKTLNGVVVGVAMKDTAKVAVQRYVKHPKYKKFVKMKKNHLVHDEGNTLSIGDKVTIEECRPISKKKHFIIKK